MATEQAELERAGLAGGTWGALGAAELPLLDGTWVGLTGDGACVGVGRGVTLAEVLAAFDAAAVDPEYVCPSSPGANESVEQKPSEELMIKVNPSFDLFWFSLDGFDSRGGIDIPSQISKSCKMQVAHNTQRSLLMSIKDHHSVLRSHGIDNAIRKCKHRRCGVLTSISTAIVSCFR